MNSKSQNKKSSGLPKLGECSIHSRAKARITVWILWTFSWRFRKGVCKVIFILRCHVFPRAVVDCIIITRSDQCSILRFLAWKSPKGKSFHISNLIK